MTSRMGLRKHANLGMLPIARDEFRPTNDKVLSLRPQHCSLSNNHVCKS
jgi:hypothetical protein